VVREGNLGFAEAYLDGWWDTPDLQAFMDVLVANMASISQPVPGSSLVRWYEVFRHRLLLNTRSKLLKIWQSTMSWAIHFMAHGWMKPCPTHPEFSKTRTKN
jgi:hypothetical protein